MTGFLAASKVSTAWLNSYSSGPWRRNLHTRFSNKYSGKSNAKDCTSWQRLMVAGPHKAGSVSATIAFGKACINCSGRVIR